MTLKTRRFIFLSLIALFLVAGAGLVFYAQGWRLDWKTLAPVRVGGIYIRTFPAEARIFLDGKEVRNQAGLIQSGTFIQNLFPKSYRLTVTMPGFQTLERNVAVKPSLVSQLEKLVLTPAAAEPAPSSTVIFPKIATATGTEKITLPKTVSGKTTRIKKASRAVWGFSQDDGEFYLYRPADNAFTRLASDVRDFFFSASADKVAVLGSRGLEIFSLNGKNYWRFNLAEAAGISELIWYKDGEHIFVLYPEKTRFLDLSDAGLEDFAEVAPSGKGKYDPEENVFYYLKDGSVFALKFPG
jgi:hypothetical protein